MLNNSRSKIALWTTLGVVFTGGAVSLLVLALVSGSGSDEEPHARATASTSWYTTQPPETSDTPIGEPSDPGQGATPKPSGGGTISPTVDPTEPGEPTELPTPVTVVTQTVVAVPPSAGGDGPGSLITAFGSLLSGAAAVGTLLHAVHLSRQNRSAVAATDDDATPAPSS
ncbi:hypothetical protein QQM39_23980 [Streptomyces sp. DT2A-34]|uniref:hypothetical protein n=1 Tax=Streptomyces sp. DT2A-34 TaxID=3051182 RepID=UPI00265BB8F1|nr:hypothetical protein [Streptomyces sp. DT2A-34]MDO0913774.1 hypothetical protein [Streptomyces sp. DT2A-34]